MPRLNNTLYNAIDEAATGEVLSYKKVTTYTDGSAMTDAKVDGVIYQKEPNTGEYFKRTFSGLPRGKWFGIVGDGGSKSTLLNTVANYSHIRKLVLDSDEQPDVTMNAAVNFQGKALRFDNSNKLKGTGALSNVMVDAQPGVQIFDYSLPVSDIKNTTVFASWFGFLPTATAAQNTTAAQRISSLINMGGGNITVVFERALHLIGKQTLSGATNQYYAWGPADMFAITTCSNVIFEGSGAIIKIADGTKAGSYNPVTGAVAGDISENKDYWSSPGTVFQINSSKNITLRNFNLDGNIPNLAIGGHWGSGYECGGEGIHVKDVDGLLLDGINSYNHLTDGLVVNNFAYNEASPKQKVTLLNSRFLGNGRQGLSWIGGNNLHAINCDFSNTGQTLNTATGTKIASYPQSGLDIEPETDGNNNLVLCTDGVFDNCRFQNCGGNSVLIVSFDRARRHTFNNCIIENPRTGALWADGESIVFNGGSIIGTVIKIWGATSYSNPKRTKFLGVEFTMDHSRFSSAFVANDDTYQVRFDNVHAVLDHCTFDNATHPIYIVNAEIVDCVIKNNSTDVSYMTAIWRGKNFVTNGNAGTDVGSSYFVDTAVFNGVERVADGQLWSPDQHGISTDKEGMGIGGSSIDDSRVHVQQSSARPYAFTIDNRNNNRSWGVSVDGKDVDDGILAFTNKTNVIAGLLVYPDGTIEIKAVRRSAVPADYADNAAALAGGLTAGQEYRTGDVLKVVH